MDINCKDARSFRLVIKTLILFKLTTNSVFVRFELLQSCLQLQRPLLENIVNILIRAKTLNYAQVQYIVCMYL